MPEQPDPTAALWAQFAAEPTTELRNRLVLQYSPLVKYVAGRVRAGLPPSVESADLVSEGVIGLMDAIDKFQPDRGLQFQTYAVPRIRGAIIDSIRAADWVPRSVRTKVRDVDRVREELQVRLGRPPEDAELAEATGLPLPELREVLGRPTVVASVDHDELSEIHDGGPRLDEAFEDEGTRELLMRAVRLLPERDQVIVALYFFEGLTLAEIGQVLDVTESRVSQLRSRATKALRVELAASLSR
ncbi:RNA polymerase sigma factor [Nocardioides psychrotolerans]|uniref:RNA polymerase sigma factor for flagellar operon FliA n=1 Tax=Nocardioides psychrotolerans TaxID=1005945 RepID=A0A1I3BYM6_9ACTN|nr:FliA/WhiG family RNA polymerase sigma factor [Nocardioides psychrotolerans]GEP36379.1 RNA polymerase sigma factor [Nocardioides psychrotolerans]SFH67332.1 RNA polymerase sigma factor for flagellar operon FliA [Nocardioides psychrotolerans]